ncbi:MAG: DUF1772 domain-containing protein [Pseudomonadales bacterium]|nr:DUF1772 domain-containing protein [Pseudomonadales bacterium]
MVLNRSFLAMFFGTAVLSLLAGGIALAEWDRPGAGYCFAAGSFYFLGTFGVTALGNVPLNDELASVSVTDPGARDLWEHYLGVWTMWNLLRTLAAMIAALLFLLGLIQNVRV